MKMLVMNLLFAIRCFSFHLTGPRVQLDTSQLPSGVLADVPCLLAHQVGPVTSEILETFWGQQPLTPLCWVGGGLTF